MGDNPVEVQVLLAAPYKICSAFPKSVETCKTKTNMPFRIEICAGLGSGKTTLTKALESHGFTAVHENFEKNPHLDAFYAAPGPDTAYAKDLWYIEDQGRQLQDLKDKTGPFIVDYSCVLSQAYIMAGLNTPENKATLMNKWKDAIEQCGWPDVVIVLDLPTQEQMKRIQSRGRISEKDLPMEFLRGLNVAIEKQLAEIPDAVTVLRIDACRDFRNDAEISKLYKEISAVIRSGRGQKNTYLNFK